MSFYVILPSNSSFEYYPENTLNNYTTKLHSTLRLGRKYEVGLVEMSYPQNWIYKNEHLFFYFFLKILCIFFWFTFTL
jgi:hypothetical protein